MGLINLQTDLKNLKYGKDRFGGGSSGQPFIQNPIINEPGKLTHADDDFLFRGGLKTPIRALEDVARLTKYLFNTKSPKGFLFIAKQNLLSRTSVATEASINASYGNNPSKKLAWTKAPINQGIYTPLSTLLQAGIGYSGIHFNLLGIDPSTPISGTTEGKLFPNLGLVRYEDVVRGKTDLTKTITVTDTEEIPQSRAKFAPAPPPKFKTTKEKVKVPVGEYENRLIYLYGKDIIVPNDDNFLFEYKGGPGSILGIGKTRIPYADRQRTGINNPLYSSNQSYFLKGGVKLHPEFFGGEFYVSPLGVSTEYNFQKPETAKPIKDDLSTNNGVIQLNINNSVYKPNSLEEDTEVTKKLTKSQDEINKRITEQYNPIPGKNIEKRVNLGDPGKTKGSFSEVLDKVAGSPIYLSPKVGRGEGTPYQDLVMLRMGIINPSNPSEVSYLHFRSFLDSFSDSYSADWKSQKYMGRAESFYKYDGFNRDISMAFTVAAQSRAEMNAIYKKLNYLASSLAPTYTSQGYMAGNLVKLTVGDYIYEQHGFISSLTYDIPDESPWDLSLTGDGLGETDIQKNPDELPMIIKVTGLKFTPIHDFRPEVNRFKTGKYDRFITNKIGFKDVSDEAQQTQLQTDIGNALGNLP